MKAIVEHYLTGVRQDEFCKTILLSGGMLFCRHPSTKTGDNIVTIGQPFDSAIRSRISRVQASIIVDENGTLYLLDGNSETEEKSANGVFLADKRIDKIELYPGLRITLFNVLNCVVQIQCIDTDKENLEDTYTGEIFLEAFQEQIKNLEQAIAELKNRDTVVQEQIDQLVLKATERDEIDRKQFAEIARLSKDLRRAIAAALGAIAIVVMLYTVSGDLSANEKEEWRKILSSVVSTAVSIALVGGAVKLQENK